MAGMSAAPAPTALLDRYPCVSGLPARLRDQPVLTVPAGTVLFRDGSLDDVGLTFPAAVRVCRTVA